MKKNGNTSRQDWNLPWKNLPEFAREFDLNPDMIIVQGGVDAHMAMFGLNVIVPNKIGVIMGTSFVHLCLAEEKRV